MTKLRAEDKIESPAPKISCLCPYCGAGNMVSPAATARAECFTCRRPFRVLAGHDGRFNTVRQVPEPLHLPKGSVRALVTLTTAGICWLLILREKPVPDHLLGLLLAVIGYYFGFRRSGATVPATATLGEDGGTRAVVQPLFLPGGSIRFLLIAGFLVAAMVLINQGRILDETLLEFYAIFSGLVLGHVFARLTARFEGSDGAIFANHLKGAAVLAATFLLAFLLLRGLPAGLGHWPTLALSCLISFYFGSKS